MTDSFSSACDSARNFFRRRWRWVVGALVLYFIFGDYLAVFLGYAETVTETVIENGESVGKKTTSWLSPGARLLRDSFIAIAAILGIVMAGWRNFALDRQSNAASEQARNDSNRIAGEQFSGAVKLLAQKDAKNKPAIDARIGGIYSLQTLANNRIEEYGAQVVKTLIAYIKQNAQLTAQPPLKENETPKEARILGEDVKTAFNVLEQLLAAREKDSAEWNKPPDGIKLSNQDLSFSGQDFSRLDLNGSQVSGLNRYIWSWVIYKTRKLDLGAICEAQSCRECELQDANLSAALLQGAELSRRICKAHACRMQNCKVRGNELARRGMSRTDLQDADLSRAQFARRNICRGRIARRNSFAGGAICKAQTCRADLQGKLLRAKLQNTELSDAKLNDKTTLPTNLLGKIWHSYNQDCQKPLRSYRMPNGI